MAKPPVDTTHFKKVGPNYIFSPKESVFINAYNKNLTNKQLAERFGASETAVEGFIRKLKEKGLIADIKKIRPNDLKKYKKAIRRLKIWANCLFVKFLL